MVLVDRDGNIVFQRLLTGLYAGKFDALQG